MTRPVDPVISFSALGRRATPPTIARLMAMALGNPRLLSLAAGFTDNATLPMDAVGAAAQDLLRAGANPEVLQYGSNQGRPGLREVLARRLAAQEPGLDAPALERAMMITNGSQQALYLSMQVLCEPGDIVLVDRPSYFVFLEMLAGLGLQARSLPVGADGKLDAGALRRMLGQMSASGELGRLKAVYFVSYFSNPSGRSLGPDEKVSLAEALRDARAIVPVVEDAAYRELYFGSPHPASSVLGTGIWGAFPRLYLSTLTKPFATGLKVGYGVCTDETWFKAMLHVKGHHDFGTANFNQALFETFLRSGAFDRQLDRLRPAYFAKMQALQGVLRQEGLVERGWRWSEPAGGLYLWLEAPTGLDTGLESAFCQACIEAGVLYVPGELCFGDAVPRHFARLSYGVLPPADLVEAGKRFAAVARRFV